MYASVPYSSAEMEAINGEINSDLDGFTPDCVVSFNELPCELPCVASLAGCPPERPRAQRINP